MCGRSACALDPRSLQKITGARRFYNSKQFFPSYNVCPQSFIPVLLMQDTLLKYYNNLKNSNDSLSNQTKNQTQTPNDTKNDSNTSNNNSNSNTSNSNNSNESINKTEDNDIDMTQTPTQTPTQTQQLSTQATSAQDTQTPQTQTSQFDEKFDTIQEQVCEVENEEWQTKFSSLNEIDCKFDSDMIDESLLNEGLMLHSMKWGLIPSFAKNENMSYRTINARIGGIKTSPVYRRLIHSKRCVVPFEGYYEWKRTKSATNSKKLIKKPYFFHIREGKEHTMMHCVDEETGAFKEDSPANDKKKRKLMYIAALFDVWHIPESYKNSTKNNTKNGKNSPKKSNSNETGNDEIRDKMKRNLAERDDILFSVSILTQDADNDTAFCHDRMPVLLNNKEEITQWIKNGNYCSIDDCLTNLIKDNTIKRRKNGKLNKEESENILKISSYQVPSQCVGNTMNKSNECIQTVADFETKQKQSGISKFFGKSGSGKNRSNDKDSGDIMVSNIKTSKMKSELKEKTEQLKGKSNEMGNASMKTKAKATAKAKAKGKRKANVKKSPKKGNGKEQKNKLNFKPFKR